jgi:hypothetical protein
VIAILLLSLRFVLPAGAQTPSGGKLPTRWDKDVSATNPLPDYPRPQMARKAWQNLNGSWEYGLTDKAVTAAPTAFSGRILVPYPYESALSGVQKPSAPNQRLWYRRTFTVPPSWAGQRVLLHFGAVNWDSTVSVNGAQIGAHRGGYDAFDFDITASLRSGENELIVSAWNPLLSDNPADQVLGKQRLRPGGIFYTAATGIWQTVWLEPVPETHVASLKMTPDIDAKALNISVDAENLSPETTVQINASDDRSRSIVTATGMGSRTLKLPIPTPHLWTPNDPHLYKLQVALVKNGKTIDRVDSYFAMRKVSLGKDDKGVTRILLNNKFLFQVGALDQGYWPDGIYTAPTDAALRFDIEAAKKFGLNLLRKHAKVEPDRWYYWTDKLGMLVWQDMPQGFSGRNGEISAEGKQQFTTELHRLIAGLYNHPSIVVWTTFNEGWGQHDTPEIVALAKQLDPSRLINQASGWNDEMVGDIADTHAYPGPGSGKAEATRAAVNGEFGGVTMRVPGHMWTTDVFGYGATLRDPRLVTKRYQQLLKRAYELRDTQGTSAVVYTQLTDVEQESNGLLTYDRAIVKADARIVTAANQGRFPPLPPNPNPDILPTSADDPAVWYFTTTKPATDWMQPGFRTTDWNSGPGAFGQGIGAARTPWTTSDIWLRREITLGDNLPADLAFLCFHDEDVEIYVNGFLAASAQGYVTDYVELPMTDVGRASLKPGKNLIAIHCHQTIGGQYIDLGIIKAGK